MLLVPRRLVAIAEQVAPTVRDEYVAPFRRDGAELVADRCDNVCTLGALEPAQAGRLAMSRRASVTLAKSAQLFAVARNDLGRPERATGEGITRANVSVEIRQRRDGEGVVHLALDHHRQPEPQLAEPDRCRVDVHAENRAREDVATDRAEVAAVAKRRPQRRDPLERVHEEGPRSARRIEHGEPLERLEEWAGAGRRQRLSGEGARAVVSQCRSERRRRDAFHEREGSEERAGASAVRGSHERLERSAEHLGIDGRLSPG